MRLIALLVGPLADIDQWLRSQFESLSYANKDIDDCRRLLSTVLAKIDL